MRDCYPFNSMAHRKRLILGLAMCVVGVCRAGDALWVWEDEIETNAMERVLSDQWG